MSTHSVGAHPQWQRCALEREEVSMEETVVGLKALKSLMWVTRMSMLRGRNAHKTIGLGDSNLSSQGKQSDRVCIGAADARSTVL